MHKQTLQWGNIHSFCISHSHPALMSSPQGSCAGQLQGLELQSHLQLYVLSLVMFTTSTYMMVEFSSLWLCSVGGWSLSMDLLHLQLKVQ